MKGIRLWPVDFPQKGPIIRNFWCLSFLRMGLLPDMLNCGLRMRRECRERFSRHRFQSKPLVNDPGMHHDTCVTHVSWCMSGSLIRGGGENVRGIPGACATRNFTYLARGPWTSCWSHIDNQIRLFEVPWRSVDITVMVCMTLTGYICLYGRASQVNISNPYPSPKWLYCAFR